MRHIEWLTATKSNVRDISRDNAPSELERFGPGKFVGPRLIRARVLTTGDTAGAAAVCQLPGNKQGGAVLLDRARGRVEHSAYFNFM